LESSQPASALPRDEKGTGMPDKVEEFQRFGCDSGGM
jgi:hypothetical protein